MEGQLEGLIHQPVEECVAGKAGSLSFLHQLFPDLDVMLSPTFGLQGEVDGFRRPLVTEGTGNLWQRGEHGDAGSRHQMVAVTGLAFHQRSDVHQLGLRLRRLMASGASLGASVGQQLAVSQKTVSLDAATKQLCFPAVALTADEGHGSDPRRGGAVVAMAVVAGRGGEVLFLEHGLRMDALGPAGQLVHGQGAAVG